MTDPRPAFAENPSFSRSPRRFEFADGAKRKAARLIRVELGLGAGEVAMKLDGADDSRQAARHGD
jgi:hypothetical protein